MRPSHDRQEHLILLTRPARWPLSISLTDTSVEGRSAVIAHLREAAMDQRKSQADRSALLRALRYEQQELDFLQIEVAI